MSRSERFFLIVQRTASLLVLLVAILAIAMLVMQWLALRSYQDDFIGSERQDREFGGKFERTLPYSGQEIETADGALIAIMQHSGNPGERAELGGITLTNPTTGKFIEIAPRPGSNVVQFELIFEHGDESEDGEGKVVGYLATVATLEQYEQGRQDLIVGALPAMTRNLVARNIRYSDLPRIRGDGSVGMLMWPEEGEAYLMAIRLSDGQIIERTRVTLPTLKENTLSQGTGSGYFALGKQSVAETAPRSRYSVW